MTDKRKILFDYHHCSDETNCDIKVTITSSQDKEQSGNVQDALKIALEYWEEDMRQKYAHTYEE